jgi:phage baseplate assembly protein W
MSIDVSTITAAEWAIVPSAASTDIVTGDAVIAQEIALLFGTPKGSIPGDPDKGMDAEAFIDRPIAQQVPEIVKQLTDQIARYIPRIVCDDILCSITDGSGDMAITVYWHFVTDGVQRSTEVPYGR